MGRKRKKATIQVDSEVMRQAAVLSLTQYCYMMDDCSVRCKLFKLCQTNFRNTAQYGDFAHWRQPDLMDGMETVEAYVKVGCCLGELTMTSVEKSQRK